jgi:hypothetical protein
MLVSKIKASGSISAAIGSGVSPAIEGMIRMDASRLAAEVPEVAAAGPMVALVEPGIDVVKFGSEPSVEDRVGWSAGSWDLRRVSTCSVISKQSTTIDQNQSIKYI